MSESGLLIAVIGAGVISLGAVLWVVWPLLRPGRGEMILEDDRVTQLIGRKDATLRAIKELEFDYRVGKIDEEDYKRLDQRLRRQAIGLIQQIEKLAPATSSIDDALEAEIAKRRQTQAAVPAPAPAPTASVTAASAPAPVNGHEAARFCTNCGAALDATHKFCANCGTPVSASAVPVEQEA